MTEHKHVHVAVWLLLAALISAACTPVATAPGNTPTVPPFTTVVGAPTVAVATPKPTTPPAPAATATSVPTATKQPTAAPTATPAVVAGADWAALVVAWERDLWLLSRDGNRMQRLTEDGGYSVPRSSPDGRWIAYVQGEGLQAEVGVIGVDGSGKRLLTDNDVADLGPAWSPDGGTIAFTRSGDTNGDGRVEARDEAEVWLMAADGDDQRRLASGRDPAWSPEGLRLAFATNGDAVASPPYRRDNAINLINAAGENEWTVVRVADVPAEVNLGGSPFGTDTTLVKNPAWRPDGNRIGFSTNGHTGLVMTVGADATDLRMLDSNYEGGFGRVAWSPTGDRLAYESFPPSGLNEIVIYDPVGQRAGTIGGARRNTSVVELAWSPDGGSFAFAQLETEPYLGIATRDGGDGKAVLSGRVRWPEWLLGRP